MQGQLFTQDFLQRGIVETPPWEAFTADDLTRFVGGLRAIYQGLSSESSINEAQTEKVIIEKVLVELGWGDDYLPQVNLSGKRREDVPDVLLFPDAASLAAATAEPRDDQRYRHGLAILEAKRWLRALDRGDEKDAAFDPGAPSSQMLRYLSRAELASDRKVKWGILTNGAVWRLYWQDARSRVEEFLEINVAALLGLPGIQVELEGYSTEHGLKLFFLLFHRAAFLPQTWDQALDQTFHAYALGEARRYEEKVSQDLGARVFDEIFPELASALAKGDLQAKTVTAGYGSTRRQVPSPDYLVEVREAALILLYRLLFLFYAEDRGLLPVRDARYAPYSLRRIREQVRDRRDAGAVFSSTVSRIWSELGETFGLIDEGDDSVGMPAYNGGLFDRKRSPLLVRTKVPDKVMAPLIDALSRRQDVQKAWINYRDLSVSHLGGIYERLLEYNLVVDTEDGDRIMARPASFARKVSGSYYTHEDLVRLILKESVGRLADEKLEHFESRIAKWRKKGSLNPADWDALDAADPASAILELKICDPAMGSGHFLVSLVDYMADRVLEAVNTAEHLVAAQVWAAHLPAKGRLWESPLVARIAHVRNSIKAQATEHGWAVTDTQLDDRHIVRRMILKKAIFGVDKNLMAVELAKTALWLHTFTVGAPLSFLDHHLRCGDSLHGERFDTVAKSVNELGLLFQQNEFKRLEIAAKAVAQVAELTDIDIAEAKLSKQYSEQAQRELAPINSLLDFWRALRWLAPGWPVKSMGQIDKLADEPTRQALAELLSDRYDLAGTLLEGKIEGDTEAIAAANDLISRARALSARESFFHWWTAFPTVWDAKGQGGFDAVIGNPPWDRIKLQEVEWFSERERTVAEQARASDRKVKIDDLRKSRKPRDVLLMADYALAVERAEQNARVLGNGKTGCGDFPLLGNGDINLYSLFVERAQALLNPNGLVGLLTPSGIAADKGAAEFFKSISTTGRLGVLFDIENRQNPVEGNSYFPDVDSRFKFSVLVFGAEGKIFKQSRCAFYLHSPLEAVDPRRVLALTAEDFATVNPNTGAAPIFRNRRDADITLALYRTNPVLVRHGGTSRSIGKLEDQRVWPVKYATMFHMTNDSGLFKKAGELEKAGFKRSALNRWQNAKGEEAVPLYEGKMVQMYDHRAADVVVNTANLHRAAQPESIANERKADPARFPVPQFWVSESETSANPNGWAIGYKEITAPTNMRTMIAAALPGVAFGNKVPLLIPSGPAEAAAKACALLLANLNALPFDFVLRQKLQGQTINLFILEQLPVIAPERFEQRIGGVLIADFIREQVLHLCYTAHDMAAFAQDLGYVDAKGKVKAPFVWDDEDRRARTAALDALFFHLYGINQADTAYILDSFPIVREQDIKQFGVFRTRQDVLLQFAKIAKNSLAV